MTDAPALRAILGPDGRPLAAAPNGAAAPETNGKAKAVGFVDTFMSTLSALRAGTFSSRVSDPIDTHPWVYAAARAVVAGAAQAPFAIMREGADLVERRRTDAIRRGITNWTPGRRSKRRALKRWGIDNVARRSALRRRGVEPDLDHPLNDILMRPNPYQTEGQFWGRTFMLLAYQATCFWVLGDADGGPIGPGGTPASIWPMPREMFEPIHDNVTGGLVVGWWFRPTDEMPGGGIGRRIALDASEVIVLKGPNPRTFLQGMAPVTPAAPAIDSDLLASEHNRALIQNDATPAGALVSEMTLSKDELDLMRRQWEERHQGPARARRIAVLHGGTRFVPTGLVPADMEYAELERGNREKILAAHGVQPSIVGLTETTNYATAAVQSAHFWQLCILPLFSMIEQTIDGTLLFNEPDTVFGAFQTENVDALRAPLRDKIDSARALCGVELHVPPRTAFDVVGLDVEDYEGDDVALAPGLSTPVKDVLAGDVGGAGPGAPGGPDPSDPNAPPADGPAAPGQDPADQDPGPTADEIAAEKVAAERGRLIHALSLPEPERRRALFLATGPYVERSAAQRKAAGGKRWKQYVALEMSGERKVRPAYRRWVGEVRTMALRRFDDAARRSRRGLLSVKAGPIDVGDVVPPEKDAEALLRTRSRPIYSALLGAAYDFTVEDLGGVASFNVDESRVVAFFDARERRFVGTTTGTLLRAVRGTLTDGIAQGATIPELRQRMSEVFDIAASSARSLTVARTETGGFLGGIRNEMFEAAGVTKQEWVTAGDEAVRNSHRALGEHGPEPIGFDWLTLLGGSGGRLRFPGDLEGPAREVINCRCVMLPVE